MADDTHLTFKLLKSICLLHAFKIKIVSCHVSKNYVFTHKTLADATLFASTFVSFFIQRYPYPCVLKLEN